MDSALYSRLGISPVINGAATLTRLGGSIMPPPVVEAMVHAAQHFVPIVELQRVAGQHLAQLTRNEAAYVTSGAAAGLTLATAACVAGSDPEKAARLPHPETIPNGRYRVIVQRVQRNGYDFAVRQTGIEFVEIGPTRAEAAGRSTTAEELDDALDARTAAVVFFAGAHFSKGALSLEEVIQVAHARNIPVIVDAAAQIPPVEHLWYFTGRGGPALWSQALRDLGVLDPPFPASAASPLIDVDGTLEVRPAGADLAIYSGGKGLCGPQSTGLVLGRADLIDAIARQASPNALIGRPMKVGKEELCGLVAAVEWYLSLDYRALASQYEAQVRHVIDAVRALDLPGVTATRVWPNEAGQPLPRALITLDDRAPVTRDTVQARLLACQPPIELSSAGNDGVYVNPQTLRPGEETIIADALVRALASATPSTPSTSAVPV